MPLAGRPPNAWVVGTSFSEHLVRQLIQGRVFANVRRHSYYCHADVATIDWGRELASYQVVVFEQWQWSFLTVNLTEFLDDLSAHSPRFAEALRSVDSAPDAGPMP